ncbi:importin-5-like isoform X4 [Sitodiplosis mosellana]|uniref:importin-5-like isoform X4 n=1 Tax=Sitodiplosis mosellana TaxID=263140 RepID=UPI0024448405|nr:importin-5-like isoform X4 [Sitodiplosis mosellana]
MAEDQAKFNEILNSLLSVNNASRQSAEEKYNKLAVNVKVTHLLNALQTNTLEEEVRRKAAVILRQLFASEFQEFYRPLRTKQQAAFRDRILLAIQQDMSLELRRKICEVVAEVSRNFIDVDGNNSWTEILNFLLRCTHSPNWKKEAALHIFTEVPNIFGNSKQHYMERIKQMLQMSMDPSSSVEVQFQAVCAVGAFINRHAKDNDVLKHFADLLPRIIFITADRQNVAIVTSRMDDEAFAFRMLVCYARELKEDFAEYAAVVVRLMVPMLKFYFHGGIRLVAAESIPHLLSCAKIKGPLYLEGMWLYISPELLKAIDSEPETDVLAALLHSLGRSIETLGPNCLSPDAMNSVLKIIQKLMSKHFEREEKRVIARTEEDYDDGVEEQLAEEDDNDISILSKVADIIHALFKTYTTSFLPFFDRIAPSFVKLLDPNEPWADIQWGLCIFNEVIEFYGPLCAQYQHVFLQPVLQYTKDESQEVRQAAIYGCGVLAQFGGDQFAVPCAQCVTTLVEIVNAPQSREPENVNLTENAISAITKILKYNNTALENLDELIHLWFNWLPVTEDEEEAPHVYGYLCDLIQANHPVVLGANNSNLPRIVAIIAEALYRNMIEPTHEVGRRMLAIVRNVKRDHLELYREALRDLPNYQTSSLMNFYQNAYPAELIMPTDGRESPSGNSQGRVTPIPPYNSTASSDKSSNSSDDEKAEKFLDHKKSSETLPNRTA